MQKKRWFAYAACVAFVAASGTSPAMAQSAIKKPVNSQTDLPRHSYPMAQPASEFVSADEATFRPFANSVLADVNATLSDYDIRDRGDAAR